MRRRSACCQRRHGCDRMALKAGARRIAHALRSHKDGIDAARTQGRTIAMTQPLFRPEVLEAKRGSWLGGISLAQPVRLWVFALAAVVAATNIVLFVTLGIYTRRSNVTGQLAPSQGLATVLAPATGVLVRLDAVEGDRVGVGAALAVVTVPRATVAAGDTQVALEQQLGQWQAGLVAAQEAQHRKLQAQVQGAVAQRELAQIESEVANRHGQIRVATETLERLRRLEGEFRQDHAGLGLLDESNDLFDGETTLAHVRHLGLTDFTASRATAQWGQVSVTSSRRTCPRVGTGRFAGRNTPSLLQARPVKATHGRTIHAGERLSEILCSTTDFRVCSRSQGAGAAPNHADQVSAVKSVT